jgi:cell division septation protein DedD
MLRSLVLILLLVNAAFFAWSQGWLNEVVGVKPDAQREPQRLTLQVNPDKIVVAGTAALPDGTSVSPPGNDTPAGEKTPGVAPSSSAPAGAPPATASAASGPVASLKPAAPPASASAVASSPAAQAAPTAQLNAPLRLGKGICVEAGPFNEADFAAAESMIRPLLPTTVWTRQPVSIQGMWLVYMGPYADAAQLERKQEELKRIKGLDFEVVRTPPNLAQGISLGRFSVSDNADKQLETLRGRGIRTARIVTLRPPAELQLLRVPRADVNTQVKLAGLKLPQNKGFTACRS